MKFLTENLKKINFQTTGLTIPQIKFYERVSNKKQLPATFSVDLN